VDLVDSATCRSGRSRERWYSCRSSCRTESGGSSSSRFAHRPTAALAPREETTRAHDDAGAATRLRATTPASPFAACRSQAATAPRLADRAAARKDSSACFEQIAHVPLLLRGHAPPSELAMQPGLGPASSGASGSPADIASAPAASSSRHPGRSSARSMILACSESILLEARQRLVERRQHWRLRDEPPPATRVNDTRSSSGPALLGVSGPRAIDQNLPHRARRDADEVAFVLPGRAGAGKTEVGFVDGARSAWRRLPRRLRGADRRRPGAAAPDRRQPRPRLRKGSSAARRRSPGLDLIPPPHSTN